MAPSRGGVISLKGPSTDAKRINRARNSRQAACSAVIDLAAERLAIGAVELQMIAGGRERRRRDIAGGIGEAMRLEIEPALDAAGRADRADARPG